MYCPSLYGQYICAILFFDILCQFLYFAAIYVADAI